jgi:transcriptional regulator with XRE-family HTH domain
VRLPRLRALRESRGLSVRQLARAAGRTPGDIAVMESLEKRAAPSTVRALARALGVEPGELVRSGND